MLPRLILLFALLCQPLMAQRKDSPVASDTKGGTNAPVVREQTVTVVRGKSVVITLRGITGTGRDITFLIRQRPKLGTFKEEQPVRKDKEEATLTYTAAPNGKGNKDTFTVAAQVAGSSVGDAATITINITDTSVKLDFFETVDARRLVLGQPSERTFVLSNGGTARWEAKVAPPKGWQWITPPEGAFKLEPGAEINARISCLAQKVGPMEESIEFTPGKKMTFVATVVQPFSLVSNSLALQWQKEGRSRTGGVEIKNLDPAKPLTVKLSGPEWLKTDPEVTIGPDLKGVVSVNVTTDYAKALSGRLKISAGSYSEDLEVTAAPTPAIFSVIKGIDDRYGFHFGKLTAASLHNKKRQFTVTNEGGSAATLKVEVPEPFRLEPAPPPEGTPLAPGEKAEFTLRPPITAAGEFKAEVKLLGGDDVVIVNCSAGVDPSAIPATPGHLAGIFLEQNRADRPRIPDLNDQLASLAETGGGIFFPEGNEEAGIPRVDVVEIAEDTGEEVTFAWEMPPGDGWKFRLMRATVQRFTTGEYAKVWQPCGNEVEYTIEGNRATAKVKELNPHVPFNFRIQTIAPDGKVSMPGKPISYRPFPPDPSHWERFREWYLISGALLVAFGWWAWKKWKQPISAMA